METERGSLSDELLNMMRCSRGSTFGCLFRGEKAIVSSRDLLNTNLNVVLSLGVLNTASVFGLQVFRPERKERVFHIPSRRSSIKFLLKEMCYGLTVVEHLIMHDRRDIIHRRSRESQARWQGDEVGRLGSGSD